MKTTCIVPVTRKDNPVELAVSREEDDGPLTFYLPAANHQSHATFTMAPSELRALADQFGQDPLAERHAAILQAQLNQLEGQTAMGADSNGCVCTVLPSDPTGPVAVDTTHCPIHGAST